MNAVSELGKLIVSEGDPGGDLREEREDSLSGVTSDDWNVDVLDTEALGFGYKGVGTDDVEGGDTHNLAFVVDASCFEDFRTDWDSGIDGVGDDVDDGGWAMFGDSFAESLDDAGVDVEEIVSGHAWLTWHTCWDDDEGSAGEGSGELVRSGVTGDLGWSVAMREISCDPGNVADIVERKLCNGVVHLEEHREGLADATSSTQDSDFAGFNERDG